MPPLPVNRLQHLQMQSNGEQWRYPRTTLRCGVDIQVEKAEICWDYSTQVILWRRRPKLYHYTLLSWGCDNCLFIVSSFVNLSVWLGLDLMDTYCGLMKITIPHERAFVNARLLSLFYLAWTFLSFQRQDFCVSLASSGNSRISSLDFLDSYAASPNPQPSAGLEMLRGWGLL